MGRTHHRKKVHGKRFDGMLWPVAYCNSTRRFEHVTNRTDKVTCKACQRRVLNIMHERYDNKTGRKLHPHNAVSTPEIIREGSHDERGSDSAEDVGTGSR